MNGILNTGVEFWQIIVTVVVLVLSVVAVRISFKFDVNKFLDSKRASNQHKLINACTHVELTPAGNGKIAARSYYISPPGTIQWQCQRCGHTKHIQGDEIEREMDYYLKNLDVYAEKNKKFVKILKKLGAI